MQNCGAKRREDFSHLPLVIRHLYFHIPFCAKLCPYCCFYVETTFREKTRRFLDALCAEIDALKREYELRPETIYFGGGTPTALSISEWNTLAEMLRERIDFSALKEWTVEANPATVSEKKAGALKTLGVTRISLGVQSWDNGVLQMLGRNHDDAAAEKTHRILRAAGFENISMDLMFGIPGQTMETWRTTLERTIAFGPEHVSAYCLTYEQDTEYFLRLGRGEFRENTELEAAMFECAMETLSTAGFEHYEISNYAKPGRRSRHNLACWQGNDYLGIGPSAFSTVGLKRWQNLPDIAAYNTRMLAGESVVSTVETLDASTRQSELAAFGIRCADGLPIDQLAPWMESVRDLQEAGLLINEGGLVRLTTRGKLLADTVAEAFV